MNRRVLVADDEELIRKSLTDFLINWGWDVKEVEDGDTAIDLVLSDHFDLFICDTLRPDRSGWDVLREVKSNPKTKNLPVIFLTTKNEDPDLFQGYTLGADYYITKPFTKTQLLQGIHLMLEGHLMTPVLAEAIS